MTLTLRVLTSREEVAACGAAWDRLAAQLGPVGLFHDLRATLANLDMRMAKRACSPHVLTLFDGDEMIAAAPLVWERGRLGLGVLYWADSDTPLYTALLCRPDRESAAFAHLAEGLLRRQGLRKLKADYVPDDSALARFLSSLGATPADPVPTPHANLGLGPVTDRLSTKRRKALRYYRRKLDALGPVRFEMLRTPDDVAAIVAWIFARKREQLADDDGPRWIHRPQTEGYFRDLATARAAEGEALGHTLRVGDRIAAASLSFRRGDTAFYSKIAYDTAFAPHSPGWLELLDLSGQLSAEGVRLVDLMIGPGFVKEQIATGASAMRNWRWSVNPIRTLRRTDRQRAQ